MSNSVTLIELIAQKLSEALSVDVSQRAELSPQAQQAIVQIIAAAESDLPLPEALEPEVVSELLAALSIDASEEEKVSNEEFIAELDEPSRWDYALAASHAPADGAATDAQPASTTTGSAMEAAEASASAGATAGGASVGAILGGVAVLAVAAGGSGSSGGSATTATTATSGLTVTQSVDDSGADDIITLTFTFDEDVTGFEASDISVSGGTKGTFTPVSATTYTLAVTSTSADNAISFSVAQGAASTLADGTASAAVSASFDLSAPSLQSVASSAADQTITLTFDEAMGDVTASAFAVTFDGGSPIAPSTAVASGNTVVLTFASGSFSAGDSISIGFTAADGALEDVAGNDSESFSITSGLTADGYIKGATIYLELEDGSRINTGIVTDAEGNFFLTPQAQTLIGSIVGDFSIVAVGGFNVDTGLPNTQEMRAPEGSTVINPLTTLIDEVYQATKESGGSLADAQAAVKTSLGITTTEDLTTYDPISGAIDGDTGALEAQQAAAKVATTIAYAESESGSDSTSESVVTAIVTKVVAGDTVDLENETTLTEITGITDTTKITELKTSSEAITAATSVDDISTVQSTLLDKIAPSTGTVSLTAASDTGASSTDGLVNSSTVDVKVALDVTSSDGTAVSLGNVVKLFINGAETAAASATVTSGDLAKGYVVLADVAISAESTSFTATITDKAGNASDISDAFVVALDNTAPEATVTTPISEGYINATEDDSALTVAGTAVGAEAGDKVTLTLTDGSTTVTKAGLVSAEAFSIKVSAYDLQKLAEGTVTVTATVVDAAGNSDAASASYVYDKSAPAAPGNLALATDSGSDSGDGISTSIQIQSITGVESTATSEYRVDGGAWSETYTAPTTDGQYTIEARQTDAAGNVSDLATLTAVLDTTDPSITSATTAAVAESAAANSLVYVAAAADATGLVYSLAEGSDSALTIDADTGEVTLTESPDLSSQTSYAFTVVATDAAGNMSEQAVTLSVTNVNEAPTVSEIPTFTAVTSQAVSAEVGDLSQYFSDADISEAGDELTFELTGTLPAGLAFDTSTGVISGTATETAASATFTITATDVAGELASQDFTFIAVDAPAILSFTIADADTTADYGNAGNSLTVVATLSEPFEYTANGATPTLTLSFGTSTATASLESVEATSGTMTFTATAPEGDATSTSISAIDLGAATVVGTLSGQAMITDAYGSPNTTYVLDNTVATPDANLAVDSGESAEDDLTNDATVNVTLADDVASWEYTTDGGTSWNTGTGTSFELADDTTYAAGALGVRQTDLAGNTSAINSNESEVVTDMTAPTFSSSAALSMDENTTAVGDITADADDTAYSLSGADAAAFSISEAGALALNSAADFETQSSYTLTVTATDAAGNSQTQDVTVTVNDVNDAPTAEGTVATQVAVVGGEAFSLDLSAKFADQDENITGYTLTAGTLPAGLSLDTSTGVISGTASASTSGAESETVTITATDAGGATATQTFLLQARTVDELDSDAPVFVSGDLGATLFDIFAPESVLYTAQADDVTTLTYSLAAGVADNDKFTINAQTGEVVLDASAFTPTIVDGEDEYDFADAGYTVQVTATDLASNSATKDVQIGVTPVVLAEGNKYLQDSVMTAEVTGSSEGGFTVSFGLDDTEISESIQSLQVDVVYETDAVQSISLSDLSGLGLFEGAVVDNGDGTSSIPYGAYSLAGFDIASGPAFTASVILADGYTSAFVGVGAPEVTYETSGEVFDASGFTEVFHDVSSSAGVIQGTAASEGFGVSGEVTLTTGAGADVVHIDSPDGLMLTLTDFTSGEDVLDIGGILFEELDWYEGGLQNYVGINYGADSGDGLVIIGDELDSAAFESLFTLEDGEYVSSSSELNQVAGAYLLDASTLIVYADTNPNFSGIDVGSIQIELGANASFSLADLALSTPYLVTGTTGDDVIDIMSYTEEFDAGLGGAVATGNGGSDTFVLVDPDGAFYSITDFQTGDDTIDVTRLFESEGYAGYTADAETAADGNLRLLELTAEEAIALQDNVQEALGVGDFAAADSLDISAETSALEGFSDADLVSALESLDNSMALIYSAEYGGAMLFADVDTDAGAVDMEYMFIRMDEVATSDIVVSEGFVV